MEVTGLEKLALGVYGFFFVLLLSLCSRSKEELVEPDCVSFCGEAKPLYCNIERKVVICE